MAFVSRLLNVQFTLGQSPTGQQQTFTGTNSNVLTISGLRASAKIKKVGGIGKSQMNLDIYGMTLSQMSQLSTLGQQIQLVPRNTITVTAGDAISGMGTVFIGDVVNCYVDFKGMPEVVFRVEAYAMGAAAVIAVQPLSYPSGADVATVMSGIATQAGYQFNNYGVSQRLPTGTYLPGSARAQLLKVVKTTGISWNGGDNGTVNIWPKNGSIGGAVPVVAPPPKGQMIGYPTFAGNGYLVVRHIFNPLVAFGGQIQVQSSLPQANKTWIVQKLDLALDSLVPKGEWTGVAYCQPSAFSAPVPPGTIGPPS